MALDSINAIIAKLDKFSSDQKGDLIVIKPKYLRKFWWDRVVIILLYILLAFFAVNVLAEITARYVSTSFQIVCNVGDDFIEQYCREELPDFAKYFESIVFSEIVGFLGLQYFWNIAFTGNTEHFLNSIHELSFERDKTTGEYKRKDIEVLRRLKRRMSKSKLYWTYLVFHVFPQLVIAVAYFTLTYIFRADSAVYTCYNPGSGIWTEDISNVTCIAPAITVLTQLQYINYIILACIFLALLWGFYYILIVPGYAHKIAHECVAQFVAFTGLRPEHFRNNRCDPFNWLIRRICQNDLQFLMLRLYTTNRKCAEVVADMLIEKEVRVINEEFCHCTDEDHQIEKKMGSRSVIIDSISDVANSVKTEERKLFGILVTHESESMAYMLDKTKFDKTICFNFNPYMLEWGKEKPPEGKVEPPSGRERAPLTRYHHSGVPNIMHIPSHIWSWDSIQEDYAKVEHEVILNMDELINGERNYDLLVIFTPISDKEFGCVHADHRVKKLLKFLPKAAKNTYILTYFPTSIGRFDTQRRFAGLKDRKRIPSFLHGVYMDEPTEHEEDCDDKHWKISDNVEHQIREDGKFGKVKCSFVGNVYQYEPECLRPSSQTSRKRKELVLPIREHKETGSHEEIQLLQQ